MLGTSSCSATCPVYASASLRVGIAEPSPAPRPPRGCQRDRLHHVKLACEAVLRDDVAGGAPGRTRTADAGLRTASLCPLSYGGAGSIVPRATDQAVLVRCRAARLKLRAGSGAAGRDRARPGGIGRGRAGSGASRASLCHPSTWCTFGADPGARADSDDRDPSCARSTRSASSRPSASEAAVRALSAHLAGTTARQRETAVTPPHDTVTRRSPLDTRRSTPAARRSPLAGSPGTTTLQPQLWP